MTSAAAKKLPVREFHLQTFLEEAELTMAEFIDLSILMGCDYVDKIRGIGPTKAYTLIKKYHTIDAILPHLKGMKGVEVPKEFPYAEARKLFVNPEVAPPAELEKDIKWVVPDEEALVKFMCEENGFAEKNIRSGIAKLAAGRKTKGQ